MTSDAIVLRDVAAQLTHIIIACRTCRGRGRLETNELVHAYGADMPMSTLLRRLTDACPRVNHSDAAEQCDVHSPSVAELFVMRPLAMAKVD